MSSYYQESNTSAIYQEFTPKVGLADEYNTIKTYRNFNNQTALPTFNPRVNRIVKTEEQKETEPPKGITTLHNINPY
jgi:hypothetical protein